MIKQALAIAALLFCMSVSAAELKPKEYVDFDTYVLALSWQPGFCHNQHEKGKSPTECRDLKDANGPLSFLTIHGLWPSLPRSVAEQHVTQPNWVRKGCSTKPVPDFPPANGDRCHLPEIAMSKDFKKLLLEYMPGSNESSCLDRYEYAKHGSCFIFDPEDYFGKMMSLDEEIRQNRIIGTFIKDNYGKEINKADLLKAFKEAYGAAGESAVKLSCNTSQPGGYLMEMQISLKASEINTTLSKDSFARANGNGSCGDSFLLIGPNLAK